MSPKIVFLDLEGTLIRVPTFASSADVPQSMWTTLAAMLGPECYQEEESSKHRWLAQQGKYIDWMDETVRIFLRHGLNKAVRERLVASVEIIPGAIAACHALQTMGARLAIVTGGLKHLGEAVQIEVRAEHLFSGCELYFDGRGNVAHWNLLPSDYVGKADFMRLLIREYGVSKDECVFVGDGRNDVYLAREVGLSIAFNAHPELKNVSTKVIDQLRGAEDFQSVSELVRTF